MEILINTQIQIGPYTTSLFGLILLVVFLLGVIAEMVILVRLVDRQEQQ